MPDQTSALTLLAAVEVADGHTAIRQREKVVTDHTFGDPVADAQAWVEQGATWLHLADLDGATGNRALLEQVGRAVHGRARIQVAGGIRTDADLAWARSGRFDQIVLDTAALGDDAWLTAVFSAHGGAVVAGVDIHSGAVWAPESPLDGTDVDALLARLLAVGCPGFVVTDIDHEGTRKGPDARLVGRVCATVKRPVCVAGGIARLEHLHELNEMMSQGVVAAVLDAALYEDYFSVAEALAAVVPRFDPYQWGPAQPWGMTQGL